MRPANLSGEPGGSYRLGQLPIEPPIGRKALGRWSVRWSVRWSRWTETPAVRSGARPDSGSHRRRDRGIRSRRDDRPIASASSCTPSSVTGQAATSAWMFSTAIHGRRCYVRRRPRRVVASFPIGPGRWRQGTPDPRSLVASCGRVVAQHRQSRCGNAGVPLPRGCGRADQPGALRRSPWPAGPRRGEGVRGAVQPRTLATCRRRPSSTLASPNAARWLSN